MKHTTPKKIMSRSVDKLSVEKKTLTTHHSLHGHGHIEIEFVFNGNGSEILNGQTYEMKPGFLSLLRPTDFHEIIAAPSIELYVLTFKPTTLDQTMLQNLYTSNKNLAFYLSPEECEHFQHFFEIFEMLRKDKDYYTLLSTNFLEILLITFLQRTSPALPLSTSHPLLPALSYLNQNFMNNPTLAEVAEFAHFHPTYFSKIFKETLGVNFSDYLSNLKISYAKNLLLTKSDTVLDICLDCGFNSINNFIRIFKKHTGFTPLQFRNNYSVK